MKKEFTATVRKNKANNHKYITVPREIPIETGDEVEVRKKRKRK